jgi:hypothetical protein
MTRRIEAGPVLVGIGSVLLLVSVFLDWYTPGLTGWEAFEVLDLVLAAAAVAALVAAVGILLPDSAAIERRWLPAVVALVVVVVVSQILDPPPGVDGDPDTGAWLALAAAVVLSAGAALSLARISLAFTVQERSATRRRVAAVDHRTDPGTGEVTAPTAVPEPAQDDETPEGIGGAPRGGRAAS